MEIDFNEDSLKQKLLQSDQTGATILSKTFDGLRRSWHLKVDIEKLGNKVSLWIIERGEPEDDNATAYSILRRNTPIQFSSILLELEVLDPAVQNRKTTMFFSFAHDQNQVIGHRNYISLDQLQHKTQLKIAVGMREHVLHSALVNYISTNFQRKFKEACAL